MRKSEPFVISISRMLGSGGAYIGQELSKKLNVLYLDREIVSEAAKELQVSEDIVEDEEERTASIWETIFRSSMAINESIYMAPDFFIPSERLLYDVETEIIEKTAKKGSVVIIGRGGSHIFCNHPRHISIFLHGDIEFRRRRVEELYGLDEKSAIRRIEECDKRRSRYHKTFTGHEFADARQYDICIDTSKFGLDQCAEVILKYVQQRFGS